MIDLSKLTTELLPTLEKLEGDRRVYKTRQRIFGPIGFLLPASGATAGYFGGNMFLLVLGIILGALIGGVLYFFTAGARGAAYRRDYKNTVNSRLVSLIDPNLTYRAEGGIGADFFVASELFGKSPDRYSTEDLIEGDYGKTSLKLAEIHAEERHTSTDSEGRTRTSYSTIFKGLLLIADFHKHFQGRTFVFPDVAEKMFGKFGRNFQKLGGRKGTSLIHLEDPEFEQAFAVHSTDQTEARYVLSTSMMRRILDMKNRFGKDVRLAFKDSCVWLAVPHSKAYLEPKTNVSATDETQVQQMLEEIKTFLDTIEELNLNTRIWTKE